VASDAEREIARYLSWERAYPSVGCKVIGGFAAEFHPEQLGVANDIRISEEHQSQVVDLDVLRAPMLRTR
jgi:hypothetical protein